jgi:RNA polymerase sigma factor (sigma-70 family)
MSTDVKKQQSALYELAGRMIDLYTRGLLSEASLIERLELAWSEDEKQHDWSKLEKVALRLCSQTLCEACRASDERQQRGFENLQRYLERRLVQMSEVLELRAEVLQQTLLEIWDALHGRAAGPNQPAAFLHWVKVILWRKFAQYLEREQRGDWLSLDIQPESVLETLIDPREGDPLAAIVQSERYDELKQVIQTLKNPHYRQVLLSIYFAEVEEQELAARLQARVQDIYLWRYRALQALRKKLTQEYIP